MEVLIVTGQIIGALVIVFITVTLLEILAAWGIFLLQYSMNLSFWIWEKTFPPSKKESIQRRIPEPSPFQPVYGG